MISRILYLKICNLLPSKVREYFESTPFHPFYELHKIADRKAIRSGPPYFPSHDRIIIDITTLCDLHCKDCCRSCGVNQAVSEEHISLDQITKFITESVEYKRKWKDINIEGGEPTLHPQFSEIIELLLNYKNTHSPFTNIIVSTNGFGKEYKELMESLLRKKVDVNNSGKISSQQDFHCGFNFAPCDLEEFMNADFSGGCFLTARYGLGLTMYGYYPHPICGGIDRVFGFDIGRNEMPGSDDQMRDLFAKLCPYCGIFRYMAQQTGKKRYHPWNDHHKGKVSDTWENAYTRYRQKKPDLSLF